MLVPAQIVAFALNSSIRRVGLYRIAFFIPNITSTVAIAIVFGSAFSNNLGLLNAVFQGGLFTRHPEGFESEDC